MIRIINNSDNTACLEMFLIEGEMEGETKEGSVTRSLRRSALGLGNEG